MRYIKEVKLNTKPYRLKDPVTFLVGRNNTGKTSLLKAIQKDCIGIVRTIYYCEENAAEISLNDSFVELLAQKICNVYNYHIRVVGESHLNYSREIGFSIGIPISECGRGMIALIRLLVLIATNEGGNVFLLENPENYIDIQKQRVLVEALIKLNKKAQFIIETASPSLYGQGFRDKVIEM